jgi:hypothetical protein
MKPDLGTLYQEWQADPAPARLKGVVSAMDGTIHNVLRSIGGEGDPYLASKARVLAAGAVKTYSPASGASLHTWTAQQLQPLRRIKRQSQQAIQVPDRVQIDAYALDTAEKEFLDEHGREPGLQELSDRARMPVRRIRKVRESLRPVSAEGAWNGMVLGNQTDYREEAMDYVFGESDPVDRKIIELRTGYGGLEPLPPGEVAARLKMTPTQLSRRSAVIASKVFEIEKALGS